MRRAFIATVMGAFFIAGGGVATAAFIRYVAAPSPMVVAAEHAPLKAAPIFSSVARVAAPEKMAAKLEACTNDSPVCEAAFAAFMLKAVLGTNGGGGQALADLRADAAKKLGDAVKQ